jgi:hypothetical protein
VIPGLSGGGGGSFLSGGGGGGSFLSGGGGGGDGSPLLTGGGSPPPLVIGGGDGSQECGGFGSSLQVQEQVWPDGYQVNRLRISKGQPVDSTDR